MPATPVRRGTSPWPLGAGGWPGPSRLTIPRSAALFERLDHARPGQQWPPQRRANTLTRVITSETDPAALAQLHTLFASEWPGFPAFGAATADAPLPAPLLAWDGASLVGGLAFTRFGRPGSTAQALWINGVYVSDLHRRSGIATSLLMRASVVACAASERWLFARTHVPALYRQCGWHECGRDQDFFILQADTAAAASVGSTDSTALSTAAHTDPSAAGPRP